MGSNKYKVNCSKKVTKSIYSQSVTTQKCGTFIEYIIKRHIVAINDTKVWHIPTNCNKYKTNSNKYKSKCSKYSAKSNIYKEKSNKNIRQTVANITNIRHTVTNIRQTVA